MYWKDYLSQQDRDTLLNNLNEKQKKFVTEYLKRGRKTAFANVLAKEKAGDGPEVDSKQIAEQWALLDYIDAGPDWQKNPRYFCECGRALRYQYIVQNKVLGEVKKFGINHFQEHTGISPQLAKEVVKGIERIDYEMDEILLKISSAWTLAEEGIKEIPSTIKIPTDIQQHFEHDIPLLNRQVNRLRENIAEFRQEQNRQRIEMEMLEEKRVQKQKEEEVARRRQEMIKIKGQLQKVAFATNVDLDKNLQLGVILFLQNLLEPQFRANDVCNYLVKNHSAPAQTFSSGRLKMFPDVCSFLEYLRGQGILEFVEKVDSVDRIYKVLVLPDLNEEGESEDSQMELFRNY